LGQGAVLGVGARAERRRVRARNEVRVTCAQMRRASNGRRLSAWLQVRVRARVRARAVVRVGVTARAWGRVRARVRVGVGARVRARVRVRVGARVRARVRVRVGVGARVRGRAAVVRLQLRAHGDEVLCEDVECGATW
jgi:UDP-3-O-[3-hydroxymyristoyl] glucosamine N-acyltransferase